jgi:flavin prenyltransferase
MQLKIVVAITGASGAIYAKQLLFALNKIKTQISEAGLIISKNAEDIWKFELNEELPNFSLFKRYEKNDFYAPFASGSAGYDVMIICPCSMGTLGRVANGVSDDLITRSADVILKERKKLILVPRETPYSLIHLNNMKTITEAGGIICPATPSFYSKPLSIEEAVNTVIERILILAGFEIEGYKWGSTNN